MIPSSDDLSPLGEELTAEDLRVMTQLSDELAVIQFTRPSPTSHLVVKVRRTSMRLVLGAAIASLAAMLVVNPFQPAVLAATITGVEAPNRDPQYAPQNLPAGYGFLSAVRPPSEGSKTPVKQELWLTTPKGDLTDSIFARSPKTWASISNAKVNGIDALMNKRASNANSRFQEQSDLSFNMPPELDGSVAQVMISGSYPEELIAVGKSIRQLDDKAWAKLLATSKLSPE